MNTFQSAITALTLAIFITFASINQALTASNNSMVGNGNNTCGGGGGACTPSGPGS